MPVRRRARYNKKIYCFDNGCIFAKAFKTSPGRGRLFENAVAIELKKGEIENLHKVFYWKNGQNHEVDFVVRKGGKIGQLIQVCFGISGLETRKREERALLQAGRELKCQNLLVPTQGYKAAGKKSGSG